MWLIVAVSLAGLLIGLVIVGLAGWSLWRSARRLMRSGAALMDRVSQASDQLSTLTEGVARNPERSHGRTM